MRACGLASDRDLSHTHGMTKPALVALLCLTATAGSAIADTANTPSDPFVGQHIPPFTAQMTTIPGAAPRTVTFDSQKVNRVTAYVFVGVACPATNAYAERFKQLGDQYGPKGVDFVFIYPNSNDTSDAKREFHKQKQFGGGLIDDQGAHLARLFKAQRTSELFLANAQGVIVYHGAVDDSRDPSGVKQHYLANALDEVLGNKPVTVASSTVFA